MARARKTVDELLAEARARLDRLAPRAAHEAARRGALLVDIRSELQRERDGELPDALRIPRNVLEWRADPACDHHDPVLAADLDRHVVVVCDEGYQSSLAAATLQDLGFSRATDVEGGFQAWRSDGLPVRARPV